MRKKLYANAYFRNEEGEWFYAFNGEPVPGSGDYYSDDERRIHLAAPELLVHQMLDTDQVAKLTGVTNKSISRMLSRGSMPLPQDRKGNTPLWSRPVIEYWLANRPGKGANLRNRGRKAA